MTNPTPTDTSQSSGSRPVLVWRDDSDESRVEPGVEQAASFLAVSVDAVVAAISSGEPLAGWFVDWDASGSAE
jgi:hypothetical protein